MDVQHTLQNALALHQRGDFEAAMALYRSVLDEQPRHFDALHLLGVAQRQAGDAAAAVHSISAAIAVDPSHPIAHANLGAALQDLGRTEEALASHDRALERNPRYAMAHANRGNALRRLGRLEDAIDSYDAALNLDPRAAATWMHRGLALNEKKRYDAALDSFGRALALQPCLADAWCGQGATLQGMGHMDAAGDSYARALECQPGHPEALVNLAALMQRLHRQDDALALAEQAVAAHPANPVARLRLANAFNALGRCGEAVEAYRAARDCGADATLCSYMLAALGAEAAPAAAPPSYVQALFDQYAPHFEQHLEQVLGYRTPQMLVDALEPHLAEGASILDAGCGTGLCGPLLRPFASALAGVDLSPGMLDAARRTQAYDQLECAELCGYLTKEVLRFDAIVAADVLVYLGDLDPLFAAAGHALRPNGIIAFSTEAAEAVIPAEAGIHTEVAEASGSWIPAFAGMSGANGYVLQASGRYAHSERYLLDTAARHEFDVLSLQRGTLRRDRAGDIDGYIAVMRLARRP